MAPQVGFEPSYFSETLGNIAILSASVTAATALTRRWTVGRSRFSTRRWTTPRSPIPCSDGSSTIISHGRRPPRCRHTTGTRPTFRTGCGSLGGRGTDCRPSRRSIASVANNCGAGLPEQAPKKPPPARLDRRARTGPECLVDLRRPRGHRQRLFRSQLPKPQVRVAPLPDGHRKRVRRAMGGGNLGLPAWFLLRQPAEVPSAVRRRLDRGQRSRRATGPAEFFVFGHATGSALTTCN